MTYAPITLPEDVQARLCAYLDHLGLVFGAFDLIITPDGQHVFLECNPNGQWGWIQEQTGLPIAETIATYLRGD